MIVGGALRAHYRRLLDDCQRLLDDCGWQGFIEDSDHPAHDLRLVLEEVMVLESAIEALAAFIEAGPGGAHEHEQATALAHQADVVIAATRVRLASLGNPEWIGMLDERLTAVSDAVHVAAADYCQRRADERHSLADALFGG